MAARTLVSMLVLGLSAAASAQPDPSGIEFVTIGAPGNAPYQSPIPNDFVSGRGSVGYEYKIGKYEVTTAQWVEFFNAAYDRPQADWLPHLIPPNFWGAVGTTPNTPGGRRWRVPVGNEMLPVGNISWRIAAMYCNWQHHGRSAARESFLDGAYDVGTFGFVGNIFTDQLAHSPGARYWIPTWDEWLKASHFDPARPNPDGTTGGWWQYSNGSDSPYVYGPPGVGMANAGQPGIFNIPLGAYVTSSPWGLYDVSGQTTEWTESVRTLTTGQRYRVYDGSYWNQDAFVAGLTDLVRGGGSEFPHISSYEFGLRIATVPAPGMCACAGVLLVYGARRRRPAACSRKLSPSPPPP